MKKSIIAVIIVLVLITTNSFLFQKLQHHQQKLEEWVIHTHEVIINAKSLIKSLTDAETAQRGYLLTLDDKYLQPYYFGKQNSSSLLNHLQELTLDNHDQQRRLKELQALIEDKYQELQLTVELSKTDMEKSLSIVKNDSGKIMMDKIRVIVDNFIQEEEELLEQRKADKKEYTSKLSAYILSIVVLELFVISSIFYFLNRQNIIFQKQLTKKLQEEKDAFLQNESIGVFHLKNLVFKNVNKKFADIYGFSVEEIIGNSPNMFTATEEEFAENLKKFQDAVRENISSIILEERKKDGKKIYTKLSLNPIGSIQENEFVGIVQDITDEKTQEKKIQDYIRENEKNTHFINTILENSPYSIITTDIHGTITLFNKQAYRLLGYTSEELVGKQTPAIFHKESEIVQRAKELSERFRVPIEPGFDVFIVKTEFGYENSDEWTYITKHGKEVAVKLTISKLIDPLNKTIIGYMGMAEDITKEKEVQKELIQAQESLNIAQQIANIGSWTLDLTNNHLTWSDQIFHLFEIDKEKFEASYDGFLNSIHPEDVEMVNEAFSRSVEKKEPYNIEHRLQMPDGRIKYVIENGFTKYNEEGEAIFSQGTVQDVTDLKKLERNALRYLDLIDQNIITSSTDLNGIIREVSQAFCNISGYTKSELIGQNHNLIKHPDMPKKVFQELWNTIKDDKTWRGEIKNRKKDGSHYWVKTTISPRYDDFGKKIGYASFRQDITDQKIIEKISITDGLTNIYNRRHFNELFPKVINSAKRRNELVSFLLIDIDHFKQYNDTYGHQMGDEVLIKVAKALKDSLTRADDYCFRLGGEEFGVIFKTDSKEKAIIFANTIKTNIEKLHIKHARNSASPYVTASMGLLCKNAQDIPDDDIAYKDADDLLYEAKENGRNKVVSNS